MSCSHRSSVACSHFMSSLGCCFSSIAMIVSPSLIPYCSKVALEWIFLDLCMNVIWQAVPNIRFRTWIASVGFTLVRLVKHRGTHMKRAIALGSVMATKRSLTNQLSQSALFVMHWKIEKNIMTKLSCIPHKCLTHEVIRFMIAGECVPRNINGVIHISMIYCTRERQTGPQIPNSFDPTPYTASKLIITHVIRVIGWLIRSKSCRCCHNYVIAYVITTVMWRYEIEWM